MNNKLHAKKQLAAVFSFLVLGAAPARAVTSAPTISLTPAEHNRDYADKGQRVAANEAGKFLAVWSQKNTKDPSKTGIYGKFSGANSSFLIHATTPPEALSVSVGNTQAVVAWTVEGQVHAKLIPLSTTADLATDPVYIGPGDTDGVVSVAIAASNDSFTSVWRQGLMVWLRQFDNTGTAISDAQQVTSNCSTEKNSMDIEDVANKKSPPTTRPFSESLPCTPDVAMNATGDTAVVVWDSGSRIYQRNYKNGNAQNTVAIDTTPPDTATAKKIVDYSPLTPTVDIASSGNTVVVWSQEKASSTIKNVKSCAAGKKACTMETQYVPSLTASVVATTVNSAGIPAPVESVIVKETSKIDQNPQIDIDDAGNIAVAWSNVFLAKENVKNFDSLLREKSHVQVQKFMVNAQGKIKGRAKVTAQKATRMAEAPVNQSPSVALLQNGSYVLVWDSGRASTPLSSSANSAWFDVKQRYYPK